MKKSVFIVIMVSAFFFSFLGSGYSQSILVDRYHSNTSLKWLVEVLSDNGWVVDDLNSPVSNSILNNYDVFIVATPNSNFTNSEKESVRAFVEGGGGYWAVAENHAIGADDLPDFSSEFGLSFNSDHVVDLIHNDAGIDYWPIISTLNPHPITDGLSSFAWRFGCTLNITSPAFVVASGDGDAYSIYSPVSTTSNTGEMIYTSFPPVIAAVNYGSGASVYYGDVSIFERHEGISENERLLILNTANWLANPTTTPTIDAVVAFISNHADIVGIGPGKSANNKYNAFMNMLLSVADLIEAGDNEGACGQLNSILKKCDGLQKPPDFIAGNTDTMGILIGMLDDLTTSLQCE